MNVNYLPKKFLGCESSFEDADFIIFGAPFDGTTTFRPGTRFAPQTMRIESIGLETYSPYFDLDIEDYNVNDNGDLDLPFGATQSALDIIQEQAKKIFDSNKKPLMIGGEHLVSLPVIKEAFNKYPDLHIIHFDAHTDLREEYLGEKLSHSSVFKRVWDFIGDNKIYQFGIRSGTKEEFYWAKEGHVYINKFNFDTLKEIVNSLNGKPVYFSIDLDVLDPSIMSGTGTTEAGGVSFNELINAIKEVSTLNIIGADIVELSPHYDHSGVSTAVACKILREMLCAMITNN
ncbi:agmatinase [uncultured Tyzzerella sp.]|uniref:agmatinase n=1 Tax=uncultured Tyzzerella sp. TaxID=2321398 RepID=UPI0029428330|nr:agmatinase [uncultured Tyzzerella sp.]